MLGGVEGKYGVRGESEVGKGGWRVEVGEEEWKMWRGAMEMGYGG